MYTVVVTIHIIVCVILVLTVLLQQGKGAEVGAVFGSSEAMFGSAGPASALNKVTTVVAIVFMLTSLALTYLAAHRTDKSVMEGVKVEAPAIPPAQDKEAVPSLPPVQQEQENSSTQSSGATEAPVGNTATGASAAAAAPVEKATDEKSSTAPAVPEPTKSSAQSAGSADTH